MNKPHKHKDLIIEWASTGKQVQCKDPHKDEWLNCMDNLPSWDENVEYRFAPKTIRFKVGYCKDDLPHIALDENQAGQWEASGIVKCWLTPWMEKEVEEVYES